MLSARVSGLTWKSFCSRFRQFSHAAAQSRRGRTDIQIQFHLSTSNNPLNHGEILMLKVGLVGLGYWGPNLARVVANSEKCEFSACCDLDPKKLSKITRQYPSVKGYGNFDDFLDSDVDAVLIATNIGTHYDIAKRALLRGKHVFVEKPLADSSEKAAELTRVGHFARRIL